MTGSFVAVQIRAAMSGLYLKAETKTRQNSLRMKSFHPELNIELWLEEEMLVRPSVLEGCGAIASRFNKECRP